MRGGVTDDLQTVRIFVGDDRKTDILLYPVRGIDQLTVHATGERRLAQACADVCRNFVHRDRAVEAALTAIRQCHDGHDETLALQGLTSSFFPDSEKGRSLLRER